MEDFCIFYGHLVNAEAIWYILWPFGIFYGRYIFPVLVCFATKNLATLRKRRQGGSGDNRQTLLATNRATRRVCEKIAQNVARAVFVRTKA
jgi:hypothetical protein